MESTTKEHLNVVIIGHVDAGKCYLRDTPILMADGQPKEGFMYIANISDY